MSKDVEKRQILGILEKYVEAFETAYADFAAWTKPVCPVILSPQSEQGLVKHSSDIFGHREC